MKTNKRLSLVLVMLLCVSVLLAGCGSSSGDGEGNIEIPVSKLGSIFKGSESGSSSGGGSAFVGNPNGTVYVTPAVATPYPYVYLPYQSTENNLVIMSVSPYSGIFLEDGSNSPIDNVSAALVINVGVTTIEYASFSLNRGDTVLEFELTSLPSGQYMVVQEKNGTPYSACDAFLSVRTDVATLNAAEFADNVAVYENESGGLTVENLGDSTISTVRVFYKFFSADDGVFVGGITYNARVDDLAPGATADILPSHYQQGYSLVVMVRTY